jgi:hypothetical protein
MAFLGGLALLGSAGEAYQGARSKQQAINAADIEQQGSVALGQGMMALQQLQNLPGGIGPPGGMPQGAAQGVPPPQASPPVQFAANGASMPGQPPPPMGDVPGAFTPSPVDPSSTQPATFAARTGQWDTLGHNPVGQPVTQPTPQAPGPQVPPQVMAQLAARLQGRFGQPPPQAPGGGMPPPAGGQPPMGQQPGGQLPLRQQPGGQPQGRPNMTPGMMDLPTLAAIIQRGNPNIKPEVFAAALQQGAKLLSPFAQQQLHEMMLQLSMQREERAERHEQTYEDLAASRIALGAGKTEDKKNAVQGVVDGVMDGTLPPSLTGMYKNKTEIEAGIHAAGGNLARMQLEWEKAQKTVSALNSSQMQKFSALADSVNSTIEEVKNLSKQMDQSGFTDFNKLKLEYLVRVRGNTPEGQLAARYLGAVNTLKEEFANLAQGGYAPTESVWHLANRQINENYGVKEMDASLDEVQRLINYRRQGIMKMGGGLGPGAPTRYTPGAEAPAGAKPAAPEPGKIVDWQTYFGQ